MEEEYISLKGIETEYFTDCLPLLEKYFGITAGYFNEELLQAKCLTSHRKGNILRYSIKENCNLSLIYDHLDNEDLRSLINSFGTITPIMEETLLLVAYCIREGKINEYEYDDLVQLYGWDIYQEEWAKLMLFMEKMEPRATQTAMKDNEPTAITIRTNNGQTEHISIPNSDNWLFRLIKKELSKNFPDVQSAEDAHRYIRQRKPSAGRKKDNAIYSAVAYGIYRMFHEENVIPSQPDMPNELCKFIYSYTCFIDCYPAKKGWSGEYSPKLIRADLAAYLKRSAANQAPRFIPIPLREVTVGQKFESPRQLD